jgi:quercetin dioxygenase-like cupin family protein
MSVVDLPAAIIRDDETRRTETPNATMTTLASPTLGGTATLSLWRVAYAAGASGPLHTMDSEQIWTLESGGAVCLIGTERYELAPGDTIWIAADVPRQFLSTTDSRFTVCGFADAVARTDGNPGGVVPPWIA